MRTHLAAERAAAPGLSHKDVMVRLGERYRRTRAVLAADGASLDHALAALAVNGNNDGDA